jgi:hypothetical protein
MWKPLKPLYEHPSTAFHFNDNVLALEVRTYNNYEKTLHGNEFTLFSWYRKPREELNPKMLKHLQKAKPNYARKSDILQPYLSLKTTSRAYVLYKDGKISRMNEIADILNLLGDVDTPAEAQLVLWLNAKYTGAKYTKTWENLLVDIAYIKTKYKNVQNGYALLQSYTLTGDLRKKEKDYAMSQTFKHIAVIDKSGKIIKFKLLSHLKPIAKYLSPEIVCGNLPLPINNK